MVARAPARRVPLGDVDPDLAEFAHAPTGPLDVVVHELGPGPLPLIGADPDTLGLLVVGGLLAQQTRLGEHRSLLLAWEGDLIRPCDDGVAPWLDGVAETSVSWEALTPAVVAELGPGVIDAADRAPGLLMALARRGAMLQARASVHQAISQLSRVSDRLLAALLLVAEERGQATVQGLVVHLPLTHERLGALIGARRPTVSLAVAQLRRCELLHRREDGAWVIAHGAATALGAALGGGAARSDGDAEAARAAARAHVARAKHLRGIAQSTVNATLDARGRDGRPS